jgi:hypothetical protein
LATALSTQVLIPRIGTHAALVTASLIMLGVGGALIIHEVAPSSRQRTVRLGGVFAAVALSSLLLPRTAAEWLSSRPWKRLALSEGAWMTRSIWAVRGEIHRIAEPPSSDPLIETLNADLLEIEAGPPVNWERVPRSARVAVVGESIFADSGDLIADLTQGDLLGFDPGVRSLSDGPSGPRDRAAQVHEEAAARFLRRTHRRYDLVMVNLADLPRRMRSGRCGAKLVRDAVRHLTGITAWLQRGAFGAESDCAWSASTFASEPCLVLASGRGTGWRDRWNRWSAHPARDRAELISILAAGSRHEGSAEPALPEGLVSARD